LKCNSSVRDFEPKILIKGVHLTNFEEKTVDFFLMKNNNKIATQKKDISLYYFLFYIQYEFM